MTMVVCLLATWFVWGSTYLAIRLALPGFPPFFQMGSRFAVAGALLFVWCWAVRGRTLPTRVQWRNTAIVGCLLLGGGAGATAYAEQSVASGLAAAFIAIEPALMVCANLGFGLKPTRRELAGLVLGLGGVILLVRGSGFASSWTGFAAMSVATVCWSAGSVLEARVLRTAPTAMGAASQMLCGGGLLLVMSAATGEHLHWPSLQATLAWGYLIVFGSLVAFSAFLFLLLRTRTAVAMSYTFVNPVVAAWLGVSLGGERLTPSELVATGIILSSVVLLLPRKANS